jgi:hypothetical protein
MVTLVLRRSANEGLLWLGLFLEEALHGRLDKDLVASYDKKANKLSPDILGSLAVVALLNQEIHQKLTGQANNVFALDVRIGDAVVAAEKEQTGWFQALQACHSDAQLLEEEFRACVAGMFEQVEGNASTIAPHRRFRRWGRPPGRLKLDKA